MNRLTFIRTSAILALAHTLSFRAYATSGAVRDIDIIVKKKPSGPPLKARTDDRGNFSLGGMEAGEYLLTVSVEAVRQLTADKSKVEIQLNGAVRTERIDIHRAAEPGISFSLKAGGTVGGQVFRAISTKGISGN